MAVAQDIIKGAMRLIGTKGQGETHEDDELQEGLTALNEMLDSWSIQRLFVFRRVLEQITLVVGQVSYSTSAFTARPTGIEDAYIRDSGGLDYKVKIINKDQYNAIRDKDLQAARPYCLWYDPTYANGNIYVYYAPGSAETLFVDCHEPLTSFATLTTTVSLPPGYLRALKYNLAIEIAPEYGSSVPVDVRRVADESRKAIERVNAVPVTVDLGLPAGRGYTYSDDINEGGFF